MNYGTLVGVASFLVSVWLAVGKADVIQRKFGQGGWVGLLAALAAVLLLALARIASRWLLVRRLSRLRQQQLP